MALCASDDMPTQSVFLQMMLNHVHNLTVLIYLSTADSESAKPSPCLHQRHPFAQYPNATALTRSS